VVVRIVWLVIRHCFELNEGNGRLIPKERPEDRGEAPWLLDNVLSEQNHFAITYYPINSAELMPYCCRLILMCTFFKTLYYDCGATREKQIHRLLAMDDCQHLRAIIPGSFVLNDDSRSKGQTEDIEVSSIEAVKIAAKDNICTCPLDQCQRQTRNNKTDIKWAYGWE
jgi:hypothetical protein